MFEDFARVWTPVAFADRLRSGRLLPVVVAGTPLVLFRGPDGAPRAFVDRCPHRGAALSLGRLVEGCLECPFHGWRFAPDGSNVRVPWNPDARTARLGADVVAVRELGGWIWLFTAANEAPPAEPLVEEYFLNPNVRVSGTEVLWHAHWTRAMENMLDWPHLAFVHRRTIGRELAALAAKRLEIVRDEQPWGVRSHARIDGEDQPGRLDYRWPNQMNLHIRLRGRKVLLAVACVPVDRARTRMLLTIARPFLKSPLLDWAFDYSNRRIAKEDQAIVESSSPQEIPEAGDEQSVRTDALTLRFRKDYYTRLKGSAAGRGGSRTPPGRGPQEEALREATP